MRRLKKAFEGSESDLEPRNAEIKAAHEAEKAAVREKYAGKERKLGERRSQCVTDHTSGERVDNQTRPERVSKAPR